MSKSTICAIIAAAHAGHKTTKVVTSAAHGMLRGSKLGAGQR